MNHEELDLALIEQPLHETALLIGRAPPELGGSSAAMLAGILGFSMIRMALAVSRGKDEAAPALERSLQTVDGLFERLSHAADADQAAFRAYLEQIKDSSGGRHGHGPDNDSHDAGLATVAHLLDGAALIVDGLECTVPITEHISKTVQSDLAGGAALLDAAFLGVSLAIQINLRAERLQAERGAIEMQARELAARRQVAYSTLARWTRQAGFDI